MRREMRSEIICAASSPHRMKKLTRDIKISLLRRRGGTDPTLPCAEIDVVNVKQQDF